MLSSSVARRRVLIAVLATSASCACIAQTAGPSLVARVDERVELLSVVFRLAGNPEYNMSPLSSYTADIDSYFAAFKDHPAIVLARQLAKDKGVGFDRPMTLAVSLSQPPDLAPVVALGNSDWGEDNGVRFLRLLRDFYRETKFQNFFAAHQAMYQLAESRFREVLSGMDLTWYPRFYGETPKARYHVILGLNNGGANYGPRVVLPDGSEELYSVMGCWTKDASGAPTFNADYLPTLIHEFNHSFVNPLVDEHKTEFAVADRVYGPVADKMQAMAYPTSEVMVQESLVRAAVILYFESRGAGSDKLRRMVIREQANGFVWMDELCDLLRQYQSARTRYPTWRSYIPVIVEFYRVLGDHIAEKIAGFNQKCAHVAGIQPFANHAENVSADTIELIVTFDKPLDPDHGYSINNGPQGGYPISGPPEFLQGGRSLKLTLSLKPDQSYSFVLTPLAFGSPDGYPLESYTVVFKTSARPQ